MSFLEVTALDSRRIYPCYRQTDGWDLAGKGMGQVKAAERGGQGRVWRDRKERARDTELCWEERRSLAPSRHLRITRRALTSHLAMSLSGPQTSYL